MSSEKLITMYHYFQRAATHCIRDCEINETDCEINEIALAGSYMSLWESLSSPGTGLTESLGE